MIQNYKEKQTVVQLSKAYSTLSQAVLSAVEHEGTVNLWCTGTPINKEECSKNIAAIFVNELKVTKKCKLTDKRCLPPEKGWKPIREGSWHGPTVGIASLAFDDSILLTADGMIVMFYAVGSDNSADWCVNNLKPSLSSFWSAYYGKCGYIYVDINGTKWPNVYGKDLFDFKIYRDGIRPTGLKIDQMDAESFAFKCNETGYGAVGAYCSGRVLINKNMDYLHCSEKLGWTKASSCKE